MSESKFIFFHKQSTSARMRFLVFENGSVLSGSPLPDLSVLEDEIQQDYDEHTVISFPSNGLGDVVQSLNIDLKDVAIKFPNLTTIETPSGTPVVHGVEFTLIDPPFSEVEKSGARFIEMTQARQLSNIDMEILRRVYVNAMEG